MNEIRVLSRSYCTGRSASAPKEAVCLAVWKFPREEKVLFNEVLLDEPFLVLSEGPTIDDLIPFTSIVGVVFLRLG